MRRTTAALAATTMAAGLGIGIVLVAAPGTQTASGQGASGAVTQADLKAANDRSIRAIKQGTSVWNSLGRYFGSSGQLIAVNTPRISQKAGTGSNGLPTATLQDDAVTRSKIDDGLLAYWAVVNVTGGLVRSQGATASANTALGRYQVTWGTKNISQCAYQATIASGGSLPPTPLQNGQISAFAPSTSVVEVRTYNAGGAPQARPFHLTINC